MIESNAAQKKENKDASKNRVELVLFTLTTPITIDGVQVSQIQLRRPKMRDMKKMQSRKGSEVEQITYLMTMLADLAPNDLDEMEFSDFLELQEKINEAGFLGNSLESKD